MTDKQGSPIISHSETGVTGEHSRAEESAFLVAASTSKKNKNTIRLPIMPVACWKVEEICFDFDRAFVKKGAKDAFQRFADLRKKHPNAPISIFGHADPVSNDRYNKKLSENRAKAVYGVLTRKAETWQQICDDKEDVKYLQNKLTSIGHDPGPIDGIIGRKTKAAITSYMNELCGDFKLKNSDFLGEGKCAYQGCSEFNPLRMFSKKMNEAFKNKDRKAERDLENEPNRRVIAFLFRPGTKMDSSKWPCPLAAEGITGCKKQFWSDAKKRRAFQEQAREYNALKLHQPTDVPFELGTDDFFSFEIEDDDAETAETYKISNDTFACRFYESLARHSPCEQLADPIIFEMRLDDEYEGYSVQESDYRIMIGENERTGSTIDGWLTERLPKFTREFLLEWRPARNSDSDTQTNEEPYSSSIKMKMTWLDGGSEGFGICFDDVEELDDTDDLDENFDSGNQDEADD
jgi:OmpA family/Putative peptidoglycan binding domain